tara:strand:- start:6710 stop:8233 length:1524 start_codon:yes stop_codon:yes gene_type:complete
MNNKEKLISVVMPTYNDAPYLPEAIDDILKQTYENFELIIINDGSTDQTQQILNNYKKKDKRIKIFTKQNGGTGSALNLGFEKASGFYGTWVSSDDRKQDDFLKELVKVLEKNKDIEYVFSSFYSSYLKKNFRPIQPIDASKFTECLDGVSHNDILTGNIYFLDRWSYYNSIQSFQGVCFLFTMELKRRCGDYIEIPGEDYHMCMKMSLETRVAYLDRTLGTHEAPADSLSVQDRSCVNEANSLSRAIFMENNHWYLSEIPKVASFYWSSDEKAYVDFSTIYSFKVLNPDWSIHLYLSKFQKEGEYLKKLLSSIPLKMIKIDFSRSILKNCVSETQKADMCKWTALSTQGGLWCDAAALFFSPVKESCINKLNKKNYNVIIDFNNIKENLIQTNFLFSSRQNLFCKNVLGHIVKNFNSTNKYRTGAEVIQKEYRNNLEVVKGIFHACRFYNLTTPQLDHQEDLRRHTFKNSPSKFRKTGQVGISWDPMLLGGDRECERKIKKILNYA